MPGDAAPPSVSGAADSALEDLRRSIDAIDDRLLDLVVERAQVVEKIGAAKRVAGAESGPVFVRPGREMAILRRLLARHSGPFPKSVVVRMWREMFAGTLAVQNPLNVAVYMPSRGAGYLEIARDQYGAYTRMEPMQTPGTVVRMVAEGQATVGVLPLPMLEEGQKWWAMLISDVPGTPKVISRLPTCGPGAGRGDGAEALAIGRMPQEPTGDDRSLLVVETRPELSRAGLRTLVEQAGLPVQELIDTEEPATGDRLHLLELSAYVAPDDQRVLSLSLDSQVARAMIIGGYAVPFAADSLA
ncbi:chorismate mutase [Novispirillum sp. DQ9]|uniref:chorismate mutase n=1 Tax=Novispirillum sp. DQ9 TaxID=3398612 RepID=UPI003C7BF110